MIQKGQDMIIEEVYIRRFI